MKKYRLRENHIILFDNGEESTDLTETSQECQYCCSDPKSCDGNGTGCACDSFTASIPELD